MDRWDLTTRKRASRKYNIVKCPVCGRYGQLAVFADRARNPKHAGLIKHKWHSVIMGGFQSNMIDDECNLTEAQVKEVEWVREVA